MPTLEKPTTPEAILLARFETLAALPNGVKKLRELILQLAVQGKLVPQNPNDEPASGLFEKIQAEKERLVKAGKLKKPKPLPPIDESEVPFPIPASWAWVRLGDISLIERGGSPRPIKSYLTESSDGFNWIKIGDSDIGGKYITSTNEKIIKEGLHKTRIVLPNDLLLTNSMSYGRPYITKIKGCIHDGWLRLSLYGDLNNEYFYFLLSSLFVKESFKLSASGAVVQNLNSEKVRQQFIPLPPLAEQERIVAKVNALMAVCDELEAQLERQHAQASALLESLIHHIASPQKAELSP